MDHSENDKRFCVYVHKDHEGNIRYIGSGLEIRANQKSNRNKDHIEIFDSLLKEIVASNLSKSESEDLEQELISKYWETGLLVNKRKTVAKPNPIDYKIISEFLELNNKSPSGLSWKCNIYSGLNKPQVYAGDFAGSFSKSSGYFIVGLKGKLYLSHRLVWSIYNKTNIPNNLKIDHIDGNKTNNRIDNLRLVDSQTNALNRKLAKNNSSGHQGVHWRKRDNLWCVTYSVNGVSKSKNFNPRVLYPNIENNLAVQLSLDAAVEFRKSVVDSQYNRGG